MKKTDIEDTRASIIADARRAGLGPEDAEDIAQQALQAALEKERREGPLDNFGGLARNAGRWAITKFIRGRKRGAANAPDRPPTLNLDDDLDRLREMAKLAGEMEQFVFWDQIDPGGTTHLRVESLADAPIATIFLDLGYYREVLQGLQDVDVRHRRRLAQRVREALTNAMEDARFMYVNPRGDVQAKVEAADVDKNIETSGIDADTAGERGEEQGESINLQVICRDPVISRGLMLLDRLGVRLETSSKLRIAEDAKERVLERWGWLLKSDR